MLPKTSCSSELSIAFLDIYKVALRERERDKGFFLVAVPTSVQEKKIGTSRRSAKFVLLLYLFHCKKGNGFKLKVEKYDSNFLFLYSLGQYHKGLHKSVPYT